MNIKQLKDAIRKSKNLSDLKRLVGPSEKEEQAAMERLSMMEVIWDKYGSFDVMPTRVIEQYNRLQKKQNEFENLYC